jgi:hypothetical protein
MTELRPGVYQHYKGPLYRVGNLARDANYEGRIVVQYIAIEQDGSHGGYSDAVRTLEDFTAWVNPKDPNHSIPADQIGARVEMVGSQMPEYRNPYQEAGWVPRFRFIAPDRNTEVMEIIRLRERDKLERYAEMVISMKEAKR